MVYYTLLWPCYKVNRKSKAAVALHDVILTYLKALETAENCKLELIK